jgi:hypothetical protein
MDGKLLDDDLGYSYDATSGEFDTVKLQFIGARSPATTS